MSNDISLIAVLALATLVPYLVACGTCYAKISIVFNIVRNALGLQQVPSNLVLNGVALMLSAFAMMPIARQAYAYYAEQGIQVNSVTSIVQFVEEGLGGYKGYLKRYADPGLVQFFGRIEDDRNIVARGKTSPDEQANDASDSLTILLPAYALSELKSAFKIGFYIYLPFVVVDLLVSSILLALGMMMMSPVTISTPIKLLLFVAMDGWSLLSEGLIKQYLALGHHH
ncbi:hypothetical protein VL15_38270 [Burkholderia cepacia]|uniref:EscR/YscR/HrcR family type III secretion system export apparatus protein n=1 Tax=Burkholderia cepacia TaxID=292 RepID=A0A0J5VSM4_BURCE|nr:EscR/YscR/HrcR family type III secretion system export apparatus protein [Burkholderia cepacia]KML40109.1 hypothetical protein VL15_38270 [Burkholderia cepacia]